MAHCTISNGINSITGALKKTTEPGVNHITVTRKKLIHDPLTGEIVGAGPNEFYIKNKRDYGKHPLTPNEQAQRAKWREACKAAQLIIHDKSHPRYLELYHRWRAKLTTDTPCMQFPNFVRAVLVREA